jgi:spermidine/putrescine transport system substrate-binding protein
MKKTLLLALALVLLLALPAWAAKKEVVVYNWTEYMPDAVLAQFTKETGIKVVYSTFDSNEAMYAKLKLTGAKGYDVIVPSAYFVQKLRAENLVQPLDKAKLPNLKNLDANVLNKPYDPENTFTVPYMWGGAGILVDSSKIDPKTVTSWADLWKPEFKNQVLLHDDVRDVFGAALLIQGKSLNETDPKNIEAAYTLLLKLKPNVRVYNSESPKTPFLNKEVGIGMIWNGEATRAMEEDGKLVFVWPKEGGMFWTDCLAIPKHAPNPDNAHAFINFLMRPDIAKAIAEEVGYCTPNKEALKMLPAELRDNPTAYPPAAVVSASQFQNDVGQAELTYEKYWELLKTGD